MTQMDSATFHRLTVDYAELASRLYDLQLSFATGALSTETDQGILDVMGDQRDCMVALEAILRGRIASAVSS